MVILFAVVGSLPSRKAQAVKPAPCRQLMAVRGSVCVRVAVSVAVAGSGLQ